ncbi:MAG: hypothetical protein ACKVOW_04515, partial [Chitinophagaceae bacterium]
MDKHLHKGIGEQFSEEINSMSQVPRQHIWENIDKQLDQTEVTKYQVKFTRLRKRNLLLLLLLIGISTISFIYYTTSIKIRNNNYLVDKNKNELNNNAETIRQSITKRKTPSIKYVPPQEKDFITIYKSIKATNKQDLLIPQEIVVSKIRKAEPAITNDALIRNNNIDNVNNIDNIESNSNKPAIREKLIPPNNYTEVEKSKEPSKILRPIFTDSVNNLIPPAISNQLSNNNLKKQNIHHHKFSLTAFVSPDLSAYRLTNNSKNNFDNKTGIEERERNDLSSSGGILLGYSISKKIAVQTGFTYSTSNISIDPTKVYAEKDNGGTVKYRYNTSFGYGYLLPSFSTSPALGDSLFTSGANHTLQYISIPLVVKYKLGNNKLTLNPGIGIAVNFLTKATLTTDVEDRFNREKEFITK